MKAIIITGISRGLGKAFFDILKDEQAYLVCISRSFADYQITLAEKSDKIELLKFDLSNVKDLLSGLKNSKTLEKSDFEELVFINNAGVIIPIGKVGDIDKEEISKSININFTSPALMTNFLLGYCNKNKTKLKIINISTGAADKPFEGWSVYCSTKAAAKMFFDVIAEEKKATVENVDPGVLNTSMQKEIRDADESDFPLVKNFEDLEKKGELKEPEKVAFSILQKSEII